MMKGDRRTTDKDEEYDCYSNRRGGTVIGAPPSGWKKVKQRANRRERRKVKSELQGLEEVGD